MSTRDEDYEPPLDFEDSEEPRRPKRFSGDRNLGDDNSGNGANKIVWAVAGAFAIAGLGLFGWELKATFDVSKEIGDSRTAMVQEFAKVNVELVKVNAKLDMGARDIDELKVRVSKLESQRGR